MDEHFHNVSFTIINRFFDKISVQSNVNKDSLWAIWNDMYKFPIKAEKKDTKKKAAKPVSEASKPETKPPIPEASKPEKPSSPVPSVVHDVPAASEPEVVSSDRVEESVPEHTETIEKQAEPVKKEASPSKEGGCQYVLTRGERAGKECGKPISKKKSETYCANHCK
jgi:hypothetical protein